MGIFIGKSKELDREQANKALLLALQEAVDCCSQVQKYNPSLANLVLMMLARVACEIGRAEIKI